MTKLKPIYLKKNKGLGNALRVALDNCSNEIVARMDSDDVSYPNRFKYQLDYLYKYPETDIVSGYITEFVGDEKNLTGQRSVPGSNIDICREMKKRCAINHVAVMFKKRSVLEAGGYRDWYYNEDYYLWIRMLLKNAIFGNVEANLVNVRVGKDMSARRGGRKYFISETKLQKFMLKHKVISIPEYFFNVAIRFVGELLVPNTLRSKLFKFTRAKVNKNTYVQDMKAQKINSNIEYLPFSVAMSVYKNDNPQWFDRALESLYKQTIKPDEIILVVDGPIGMDLQKIIEKYQMI